MVEHWTENLCVVVRFRLRANRCMAEGLKAAVLKTDVRKHRGFKSYYTLILSSSLMVKQTTHNGLTVGSNLTWMMLDSLMVEQMTATHLMTVQICL